VQVWQLEVTEAGRMDVLRQACGLVSLSKGVPGWEYLGSARLAQFGQISRQC